MAKRKGGLAGANLANLKLPNWRKETIALPTDWSACERGNVYLVGGDGEQHLAYFALPSDDTWLEVSLTPENYPAFNVAVVKMDEAELAAHIHENCDGWRVNKINIKGVKTTQGYVDAPEK